MEIGQGVLRVGMVVMVGVKLQCGKRVLSCLGYVGIGNIRWCVGLSRTSLKRRVRHDYASTAIKPLFLRQR